MFDLPLIQENVWNNLVVFNSTYLFTRSWVLWLGFVVIALSVLMVILQPCLQNNALYRNVFSDKKYIFDSSNFSHKISLLFVILVIAAIEVYMFTLENSLFENYDLMAINTTRTMRQGLVASFDYVRVIPLASWYLSTLYAITQNILIIKSFVLLQIMLVAWALYAFFNYIPVAKRLVMIGLLLISPAFVQVSNIIFPERDMLILLMLGLICARNYCNSHKVRWAAAFVFFMNCAFYTKETCITFYFGVLLTSLVYNCCKNEMKWRILLHPVKMMKAMPLEVLIGFSLVAYTIIFEGQKYHIDLLSEISFNDYLKMLSKMPIGENLYLENNRQSLWKQFINYRMELVLLGCALFAAVYKWVKQEKFNHNPLFREGLLVGALCSALLIVVIYRLAPSTPHLANKSYYMLVTLVFVLAYLFDNVANKKVLWFCGVVLCSYSLYMNAGYHREAEKGTYYRQVAEFMADNSIKGGPNSIFIIEEPYATKILWQWIIETWSTAYRYYFNDRIFFVKSDVHNSDQEVEQKLWIYSQMPMIYFPIIGQSLPKEGDWVIISKNNQTAKANFVRNDYRGRLAYENDLFEVYSPK